MKNELVIGPAILSLTLIFVSILLTSNDFLSFGQSDENKPAQMADSQQMNGGTEGKLISSFTEWIGIFALGMTSGLLAFKANISNNVETSTKRKKILVSVSILSISVGIIHFLLVGEHAKESFWWGIIFLISGIAQIGYGIIIWLVKKQPYKNILYYLGLIGNAILVITFILVRLLTPPFSPEGTPINELEPNGIITLIIETLLVILISYILKVKEDKEHIKMFNK